VAHEGELLLVAEQAHHMARAEGITGTLNQLEPIVELSLVDVEESWVPHQGRKMELPRKMGPIVTGPQAPGYLHPHHLLSRKRLGARFHQCCLR